MYQDDRNTCRAIVIIITPFVFFKMSLTCRDNFFVVKNVMTSKTCPLVRIGPNSKTCSSKSKATDKGLVRGETKFSRAKIQGAIHWTKISGNSGTKSNGTERFWKLISKILNNLQRLSFFSGISCSIGHYHSVSSSSRPKRWRRQVFFTSHTYVSSFYAT